jgi:3'-phosphoadenosine 5'-phosphosulfate (PAPS) 3'-phosphatase
MREGVGVHTKSGPQDFVTDADLKLSKTIKSALTQRFPDDLVISEEDYAEGAAIPARVNKRVWLIDPIDGTMNYIKQDGQYSSMIGLLLDGHPFYGWIYQPTTATLFSGGPGAGAWKTRDAGAPIRYKDSDSLTQHNPMRLMLGWGDRKRNAWIVSLPDIQPVPSESMGLKIVKIFENEADFFLSLSGRVKLWDTAAPAALALGGGLDVGTVDGKALPFPIPDVQHGTSVIIGRPGSIAWALKHVNGRQSNSAPK